MNGDLRGVCIGVSITTRYSMMDMCAVLGGEMGKRRPTLYYLLGVYTPISMYDTLQLLESNRSYL